MPSNHTTPSKSKSKAPESRGFVHSTRARIGRLLLAVVGVSGAVGLTVAGCGDTGSTDDDLFPPDKPLEVQPAPGGIRRLTSAQIKNSVSDLLGPAAAATLALPVDQQLHGFSSIAAAENAVTSIDVSTFESTFTTAVDTAILDLSTVEAIAPCIQNPDDACYDQVARQVGRAAWRRTVTDDEVAVLVGIAAQGKAWGAGSFDDGLKYELLTILQSPNFLYIVEVGDKDATSGYRKLSQFELASRMAFFLNDRGPDKQLLDDAEQGKLSSNDAIKAEAQRLLAKPEAQQAFNRFVGELYYISDLSDVGKDPAAYPQFGAPMAASMEQGMYSFIDDVVWTRNADARELFTSSDYFVDANTAALYGVAPPGALTKTTIPAEQKRAGIVGQAGFLARFAHPSLTSPTRRGRFVQERLLCNDIPSPPPGQNTNIPEEPPGMPMTMKQKLSQHESDPKCAECHTRMDPIGFALENYDAIGAYRADDRGMPLDTTGHVAELGDFASAVDIGAALAKSDQAAACFVKNFIRGSMGHIEIKGETEAIAALQKDFGNEGYSLQSLMTDLTVSPAFTLVDEPK